MARGRPGLLVATVVVAQLFLLEVEVEVVVKVAVAFEGVELEDGLGGEGPPVVSLPGELLLGQQFPAVSDAGCSAATANSAGSGR